MDLQQNGYQRRHAAFPGFAVLVLSGVIAVVGAPRLTTAAVAGFSTPSMNDVQAPDGAVVVPSGSIPLEVTQLLAGIAEKGTNGMMRGGPVQAIAWQRPPKADVPAALKASLEKLGFQVKQQSLRDDSQGKVEMLLAVRPSPKKSYLGLWIKKAPVQMFAWCELLPKAANLGGGSADGADSAPPDGATASGAAAASLTHLPSLPPIAAKPGSIRGVILNRSGKPIPGVKVWCYVGVPNYWTYNQGENVVATTDENGRYSLDIHELVGVPHVHAVWTTTYHDMRYQIPLMALDGHGQPRETEIAAKERGDVFHFVPVLSGLRSGADPDNMFSYYGAGLTLSHDIGSTYRRGIPANSTLRVTLAPQGPLVDGSAGRTLTHEWPNMSVGDWRDIPVGAYRVTVEAILPDGSRFPLASQAAIEKEGRRQIVPMDASSPLMFGSMTSLGTSSNADYHAELMVVIP